MSLLNRTLMSALLAGLVVATPVAAFAQPEEEEGPEEATEEGAEEGAEGEGDADEEPPLPEPDSELSEWGAGGEEPEGRFKPRGKTGALAEMEEEEEEKREILEGPPDLPPPGFVYLDSVFGFGRISAVANPTGGTDVTPVASFLVGAGYRIGETWQVYARFPISSANVDGPAESSLADDRVRDPDQYKQIATGNLEVGVRPQFILNRDLWLPVWLSLALPTSQGDMFAGPDDRADIAKAIVNQGAAASRGWEDRGLFAYQRVTVTPGVGIKWQRPDLGPGTLHIGADTKVEIMIRTGGTEPVPPPNPSDDVTIGEYNDVAVNWVTGANAAYELFDGYLTPGLRFWIPVATSLEKRVRLSDRDVVTADPGGAALVFEPYIASHVPFFEDESFGLDAKVALIAPAAGELAQNAIGQGDILGFRVQAGFFF